MKNTLTAGASLTRPIEIDRERTIDFMGDALRVYATPFMVRDVEQTCRELLRPHHDPGEDSVGARVEIDHLGPTLLGQTVQVSARVAELALPRIVFEVEVRDEADRVGLARHVRFVVDSGRQEERLRKKAERVKAARSGGAR